MYQVVELNLRDLGCSTIKIKKSTSGYKKFVCPGSINLSPEARVKTDPKTPHTEAQANQ